LIVANKEHEQEALSNLLAPGADAEALGRVLGDAQIGDFSVQVVRNKPSYVIEARIEDLFSESRPDDLLLLHFSGHGLKSESGELFFAASNTKPNRLGSTAVAAGFVQRCMRDSRSRSVVLLLDCCYGGAFAQGVKVRAAGDVNVLDSFPQGKSGGGRGRAVITASNAMEYAFEGDRLADDQHRRPSVFTSALVEGLTTGDADRDEDGLVSVNELYDYVFDKVREQNPHQTPSRQVELEGDLYLARSRRRRIRPAPIPPDLQAAITDQNMYTRCGAVHELQSRLASEDLPVAAGAYEALAELARTDIQYVADLAFAALGHAAVRPEETELHFGQQRQGSDPPHRMVRLLGPPIARACAPRASHDWIHVNETGGGFDVSVDTAGTGTLRGSVDLKGTTGEAEIAIDVELLPQVAQISPTERQSRPASESVMAPPISATRPKGRSTVEGPQQAQQAANKPHVNVGTIGHGKAMGVTGDFVRLEVADGIGTMRLDHPPVNALNDQIWDELAAAAGSVAASDEIRAVIIYGGEKVFAGGFDIRQIIEIGSDAAEAWSGRMQEALSLVAAICKPVVAAITGYALGGGLELALCADFRVAGEGARLGQPEIMLGIIPGAGCTQRLPRLVGPAKAKDIIFTGRMLKAAEAHAIGLVDLVVPDDTVYQAALDMVKPYAAGPALALRAAKQAIDHGLDVDLAGGLEIERVQFAALFGTEDQREGMRSFLEEGPGKVTFTGR
jgi:enoyl-CoA hydratase/carnithine racemase